MKSLRRLTALILFGCLTSSAVFAQEYPKVSTNGNEHWYYIRFMRTGNVLEAQSDGANCLTAAAKQANNAQLWKIVTEGNAAQKKYKIVDKDGATLCLNGTDLNTSRFQARKNPQNTYTFHIFNSSNTSYGEGGLEISPDSTYTYAMNQVGEVKVGQLVGIWDKGDMNNVLQFFSPSDMNFPYSLPTPSTAANPKYYYIQFQNGNWLLSAQSSGSQCKTASLTAGTLDDMLFRVSVTNGKYSFVSKSGKILYLNGGSNIYSTSDRSKADTLFYVLESTHSLGGYEIGSATSGRHFFNMYQGAGEGKNISVWDFGDNGNVLRFIPAEDLVAVSGVSSFTPTNRYTLWYNSPATNWMTSCLPIGNGQFGATIMGQVAIDDVQFNDKTLWSGKLGGLTSTANYGFYLNFGNLQIRSKNLTSVTDYVRYLDINDAVAGVKYKMDGVEYTRSYFVTNPDSCLVLRYTASETGKINTVLTLKNQNGRKAAYTVDGNKATITFKGTVSRWGDNNAKVSPESFFCAARVVTDGGTVTVNDDGLVEVKDANSMTVYLRGLTDYDPNAAEYVSGASQLESRALATVNAAESKGYESLFSDHKKDYQNLFNRCQLTLADAKNTIATPNLITAYKDNQKDNLFLEELYFNYGRYLLISSSRGVSLPANLQGIWNNNNTPAWHADIHSNINVQMNYWPAEPTNLSELHKPFLDYIYREAVVKPTWHQFAKDMGGVTAGWTLPTENNIYGSGTTFANNYTVANAWYCQHLWQHYTYTLDKDFLKNKALPVMKSCVEYWFAKLHYNSKDGTYECPNEWSPEHGGNDNATAHSQQLVWDLFNNTLKAIKVLGDNAVDASFKSQLEDRFKKLDTGCHTEVNPADGKTYLREWKNQSQFNNKSFIDVNEYKNHRHISHLMGLYPCDQIGEEQNDSIFQAAKVSLIARGDGHGTGWSLGHKINLNARAYMGDHCHNLIKRALQQTWTTGTNEGAGGVYENLWDAHAPYQIDGNFGYTAGIAEMLLQSHFGKLEILPAIPTKFWTNGSVKGLKAVGNFTVDIEWKDTVATNVRIVSNAGQKCTVQYKGIDTEYSVLNEKNQEVKTEVPKAGQISFETTKGDVYTIVPKTTVGISRVTTAAQTGKVKNVEYYNLNGARVASPSQKGLILKKTTFENGSSHSEKLINK